MYEQPLKDIVKFVGASILQGGERQNDKTHYQFNRDAIEQAAYQWMLSQENQLAACPGYTAVAEDAMKKCSRMPRI